MTAKGSLPCETILVQLGCHLIVHLRENRAWLEKKIIKMFTPPETERCTGRWGSREGE